MGNEPAGKVGDAQAVVVAPSFELGQRLGEERLQPVDSTLGVNQCVPHCEIDADAELCRPITGCPSPFNGSIGEASDGVHAL
jgi:hypothetical protein